MNDTLFIRGLRVDTVIGVHAWEREITQTLVLDIELACDIAQAANTDALEHAVDYYAVSMRLLQLARESSFQLVETFAETAATILREEFGAQWLRLRVAKPGAVPEATDVGILIERGARGA